MSRKAFVFATAILKGFRNYNMVHTVFQFSKYATRKHKYFNILYSFPILYAASNSRNQPKNVKEATEMSDALFESAKFQESYDVLIDLKDSNNDEVLWRISRALYNKTKSPAVSQDEVKQLIEEADECIRRAIEINEESFAVHKWFAIILNAKTTLEGTKAKIASLPTFKEHIQRAIDLNPQDPTSKHMLGTYYFNLADLAWYQKKLASALFGTVPESSFEEALNAFSEAEKTSPNFYSLNLLMLGKTYLKLEMPESASHWLQRAAQYIPKTDEDKAVVKEAMELLKKLKA